MLKWRHISDGDASPNLHSARSVVLLKLVVAHAADVWAHKTAARIRAAAILDDRAISGAG